MGRPRSALLLALVASAITAGPAAADANDPLLQWHLDDVAGTGAPDSSGSGRAGSFVGDKNAVADGRFDGAFASGTSGNAERVHVNVDAPMQSQQFTVIYWIRASSYPGTGPVATMEAASCAGAAIWSFTDSGGDLNFSTRDSANARIAGGDVYDGRWHMVAATVNGRVQRTYLDGGLITNDSADPAPGAMDYGASPNTMTVGGQCISDVTSPVNFDEVRYYNRVLTGDEIGFLGRSRFSDPQDLPIPGNDPGWSGLVGQWHLDAKTNANRSNDSGPNGVSGSLTGTIGAARFGNGLAHAVTTDGLATGDSTALEPNTLTALAWVKGSSAATNRVVMAKGSLVGCIGNSYSIESGPTGNIRFKVITLNAGTPNLQIAEGPAAASIWNGQWHAVAGTYDGSNVAIWIDGVKFSTTAVTPTGQAVDYNDIGPGFGVRTGNDPDAAGCGNRAWTGQIDEVRVYDRALEQDEIEYLQDGAATTARDLPTPTRAPEPGPVVQLRPQLTGNPITTGSGSLSCSPGTWTGHPTTYTYTWERGMRGAAENDSSWTAIPGAVGDTYVPTTADDSAVVRCHVYAENFKGTGDATSLPIRTDSAIPAVTIAPQVTGTVAADQIIHCDPGKWTGNPTFHYEWLRDGTPLPLDTGSDYRVKRTYDGRDLVDANGDGQHRISCRVTADNDVGTAPTSESASFLGLDGVPILGGSTAASIHLQDGVTNNVGRRATCQVGSWLSDSAALGELGTGYEYRWVRNGLPIGGATSKVYVLGADDLGTTLRCDVKVTNEVGTSGFGLGNAVDIPFPGQTSEGGYFKAVYRESRYDPINMMALSTSYYAAVSQIVKDQLQRVVDAEKTKCKDLGSLPAAPTAANPPKFPLSAEVRCAILLKDPTGYEVSYTGVKWKRGQFCQPNTTDTGTGCNDMGFVVPPIDPTSTATVDPALQARLDAATPTRVVWDIDGDQKTDIVCPGTAPVVRGLFDPGKYQARAIIIYADTATTGRMASASLDITFPKATNTNAVKLRKPSQPLWCRTSIVPPPDPKTAPCTGHGSVGSVQLEGNLCPINLRATPDGAFDGLDPNVQDVLKQAALAIADAEKNAENPKVMRKSTNLLTKGIAPEAHVTDPLKAGTFLPATMQKPVSSTLLGARNAASSLTAINAIQGGGDDTLIAPNATDNAIAGTLKRHLDEPKAQFATDQIYSVVGNLKVNGVTLDPTSSLPTLIVPSDAGQAIDTVKKMTINTKSATTEMAVQKIKDGVTQEANDLPLAPAQEFNKLISDLPTAPPQNLIDGIDVDTLRESLKGKLKNALDLGPFKLVGDGADIQLQPNGTALIHAQAELPIITSADGSGLKTAVTLVGDTNGNIKLQGVSIDQKKGSVAFLLGLQLEGLHLEYNTEGGLTARGEITFPASGGAGIDLRDFQLGPDGEFRALDIAYVSGVGTGIPIGPGIFLVKLGGGLYNDNSKNYTAIRAGGAVSALAPSVGGGCPTVGTEGDLTIQFRPQFEAHVVGKVSVVCIPLFSVMLDAYPERGAIHLGMHWGLDLHIVRFGASLVGNVQANPNMWQIEFHMEAAFPILHTFILGTPSIGADGLLSNKGAAVCAHLFGLSVGAGVHFPNGRPPLSYSELVDNFKFLLGGCDVGKYASFPLEGAQAGGVKTIKLDGSTVYLSIDGAGAAPKVQLKSPSGKVYDYSAANDALKIDDTLGVNLADEDRTVVALKKPEKGTWTVTPVGDSAPIVRIQHAGEVPQPKISGKVTGKGQNRTLTYNVTPLNGQVVNFIEESNGGHRIIKTIKTGGKGKVNYVVAESAGSKRELTAEVLQNDMPRDNIVLATYRTGNPKVGRPKVKIKRRGKTAMVTWGSATLAAKYYVTVTDGKGAHYTLMPKGKKRTVTVKGVAKTDSVIVSVRGVSAGGKKGPSGKATLKAPRKKKRR